jgi:arylsulfatase
MNDNPEVVKRLTQIANEARQDIGDDLTKSEGKNRRTIGKIKE